MIRLIGRLLCRLGLHYWELHGIAASCPADHFPAMPGVMVKCEGCGKISYRQWK